MLDLSLYLMVLDAEEERDKLTIIYERYYDSMLNTARLYVGQYSVDEDMVHEAILKIIENLDKVDLQDDLRARCFVCTIVENKAKDWLRREKKLDMSDVDNAVLYDDDVEHLPLESLLSREGYARLIECINELDDIYRGVCRLKYVCGLREREIAEVLDLHPKTVGVRLVRARRILKEKIMQEGIVEGKR